jgi:hypothetical protein
MYCFDIYTLVQELSIKSNQHSLHEQKYKWKGIARKKILNAMKLKKNTSQKTAASNAL